jgi:NADH:ubiquinone oxidoreductase subunit C
MTDSGTIEGARDILAPWTQETDDAVDEQAPDRLYVLIAPSDLLDAVKALHTDARWGYLATITGVDLGVEAGEIEVLYHFASGANVTTLRVRIPRDNPQVPTLYGLIPSVTFYERELIEMLGVTVEGTPNTDRLFLPDDWPEGIYPLRKDFNMDDLAHVPTRGA